MILAIFALLTLKAFYWLKNLLQPIFDLFKGLTQPIRWAYLALKWLVTIEPKGKKKDVGAKFLKTQEIRKILSPFNKGLVIDGMKKRLTVLASMTNLVLVSPIGAGKSSCYVTPNILTIDKDSMVITDPSGELYHNTSGYLKSRGFKIIIIDPTNPFSWGYNPLMKITDFSQCGEIAKLLVASANHKFDFWCQGATTLISIFIQVLLNCGDPSLLHIPNVLYMVQSMGDPKKLNQFIAQHARPETIRQFKGFLSGNDRTISSFVSVANTTLDMCNNPNVAQLLANDDIDFHSLRKTKTAIFLVIPSEKMKYYMFLINIFYEQLFSALMSEVPDKKALSVYCLLDEAGHYNLPSLSTRITTIRKYRVSISLILQSVNQLFHQYGEHEARVILEGGISNRLFYPGLDTHTAKYVEEMLGKSHIDGQYKNLLNADRISRQDQAIFISGRHEPMKLNFRPYFKQFNMRMKTSMSPYKPRKKQLQPVRYLDF